MEIAMSYRVGLGVLVKREGVIDTFKGDQKAVKWFEASPRCQHLRGIDPSIPTPRFSKVMQNLKRWHA